MPPIGSKTQWRPLGPPSDLPESMAVRTSSEDKGEEAYDSSDARVSLTSSVIRAKTVSAATFLSSAESYTQINVKKSHKRPSNIICLVCS